MGQSFATLGVLLCMLFVPLLGLGGLGLLGIQSYIYLTDGEWHSISGREFLTYTVDERLAAEVRWPELAAWRDILDEEGNAVFPEDNLSVESFLLAIILNDRPTLGSFRMWLLAPESWFRLNRIVTGVLSLGLAFLLIAGSAILWATGRYLLVYLSAHSDEVTRS